MSDSGQAPSTGPTLTFWGAAQSVTGSMHLVDVGGRKLLLDCGKCHGPRNDTRRPDVVFPFEPASIDAVILSHAHLDHCGNLPHLVRQGFDGPVYCTPATRDLVALMLGDVARRQEEDARVHRILHADEGTPGTLRRDEVRQTVSHTVVVPYDRTVPVFPDVALRFVDAGHLLGSAMVALTLSANGREQRITFTGDLGRRGLPLLRSPVAVPEADLLVSESTYGGRLHEPWESLSEALIEVVRRTAARGGKVLIPAFTLGRMQLVVACLLEAIRSGRLAALPIYVDSPMAGDVVDIYRRHPDCLDALTARRLDTVDDPFAGEHVQYVRSHEGSEELAARVETCVIVAASAMCDGGRIVRHLKHNLDDPRASIVLVSYQAPDSLGRRLLEPRPMVRFHGRKWNLWADVVDLNGFSGHADQADFLDLFGPLAGRTRCVRLVHGEREQAEALARALRSLGFTDVAIPARGDTVVVPG